MEEFVYFGNHSCHLFVISEWSTIAVRNLCEGNHENQTLLQQTERIPRHITNTEVCGKVPSYFFFKKSINNNDKD